MYSLMGFGEMIADRVRLDAYAAALRQTVKPDSIVLDIGAGTGIMAMLACKFGARHVYAVEPSDSAQLIHEAARDNGYADRITVLRERSTDLTLPERADVIVSDLRGVLPAFHRHFSDIADARKRLLAPAGTAIPQADTLFLAVASAEGLFEKQRGVWESNPYDLNLRSAVRFVANRWQKHRARPEDLVCRPVQWAHLDYRSSVGPRLRGVGSCQIEKNATAHGLLAWFDTELANGVGFSNQPGATEAIYGQAFFPWPTSMALQSGDLVDFELRADPTGSSYSWTWSTQVRKRDTPGLVTHRFRQSTFLSSPLSAMTLRKREASYAPRLSTTGEITRQALARMSEAASLEDIAQKLQAAHPRRFTAFDAALAFVADLSERYGV